MQTLEFDFTHEIQREPTAPPFDVIVSCKVSFDENTVFNLESIKIHEPGTYQEQDLAKFIGMFLPEIYLDITNKACCEGLLAVNESLREE